MLTSGSAIRAATAAGSPPPNITSRTAPITRGLASAPSRTSSVYRQSCGASCCATRGLRCVTPQLPQSPDCSV